VILKKITYSILLMVVSLGLEASTYSISTISLGYGQLDINAGFGNMYVTTDTRSRLQSVSLDVTAGFFGIKHQIKYSETIANLSSGKPIDFYMEGGSKPVLKLKSNGRFDASQGGKLNFSALKSSGYETTSIKIMKESLSNRFFLFDSSDRIIGDIGINMRGYSISAMYIGRYELNLK